MRPEVAFPSFLPFFMRHSYFPALPGSLTPAQRAEWQHRQRIAEHALEVEILSGAVPDHPTLACFQRYISGELTLAEAIACGRQQQPVDYETFRQYFNSRTSA
jgi:hypothetical protein